MTKKCKKCGEVKPLTEFTKHHSTKDGVNTHCIKCDNARKRKEWHSKSEEQKKKVSRKCVLSVYGLTEDDYNKMLDKQNHKCAICGIDQVKTNKRLFVDHCHTTGKVRGLLCSNCNTALGMVKDSIDTLSSAISYLKEAS